MGLEVANVVATLTGHFDDTPFDRFDRRVAKSRSEVQRPIVAHADTKVDTSGLDRYDRRVKEVDRSHNDLVRGSARVRTRLGTMFIGGASAAAATIGFAALTRSAMGAVNAFTESEAISKRTTNVLKTTGGAANITAKQVGDLATALSRKSGMDDEAIQSGENLLLTFTNVRNEVGKGNDIFTRATKVAVDMSAALGQDLKSSNIQLGKALNDPIKGVTALQRVGVSFTAQQKEQIKTLVQSGNTLGAQKLILKELNKEFGGAAEASATAGGKMKVALGNIQEAIGGKLAPVFNSAATAITNFANGMTDGTGAGGRFVVVARQVGTAVSGVFSGAFKVAGRIIDGVRSIIEENRASLSRFGRAWVENARNIWNAIKSIGKAIGDVFGSGSGTGQDIRKIISVLLSLAATVEQITAAIVKRALPGIVTAFRGFATIVRGVVRVIAGILTLDFGKAWDGVKDIFGGAIKALAGILRAATAPFREAIAGIGRGIASAFRSVWGGALSLGEGFVNKIIDVINIIPGVNIHHIGGGGNANAATGVNYKPADGGRPSTAPGAGLRKVGTYADGGKVTMPIAIMGEEAPQHPEWVIPTNPAYRKRAVGLWMMAAKELGIPGFSVGGIFKGAGKFAEHAASDALNVIPGVGAARSAAGLASKLIDKLPGNPGGLLSGTWDFALDKAKDFIGDKAKGLFDKATSAVGGVFSGGAGSGGLVPQVLRALAWARAHGWHGSVISGYRSPASQMQAAQQYAARRGMPISALYPNGVLASNHTTGQAVDVTDPGGFRAALANAPRGSALYGLVPGDPSHFSVTGHRIGGVIGGIGALGGELLGYGSLAFKKGGKLSPVKQSRRTIRKHEGGVKNYEDWLGDQERVYDQMDRKFGLTDEQITVEQDDGSTTVDTKAQQHRLGELKKLHDQREKIQKKVVEYRQRVKRLIHDYEVAIKRVRKALGAAKGKSRKKERKGYADEIQAYQTRIGELKKIYKSLGLENTDQQIDLSELDAEVKSVTDATGTPAEVKPPEPPDTSLQGALIGDEASQISALTRDQALAELTPDTADDESVRSRGQNFYQALLDRLRGAGASDEAITSAATALKSFLPQPTDTTGGGTGDSGTPAAPSPDQIAQQIQAALASFNSSRADLFSQFGANFLTPGQRITDAQRAAGAKLFGGGSSGSDGGVLGAAGQRQVIQYVSFTGPQPADPHLLTQAMLHELGAAV